MSTIMHGLVNITFVFTENLCLTPHHQERAADNIYGKSCKSSSIIYTLLVKLTEIYLLSPHNVFITV